MFDIKKIPYQDNNSFIFTIGVGYQNDNEWIFKDFTVDQMVPNEEERICREFITYISDVSKQFKVKCPRCFHWSGAEHYMWNDVVKRHPSLSKLKYNWEWTDMLDIFKKEPIIINGCIMQFS